MSTEVFWNEAEPPATNAEHMAVKWLVMIARQVGLTSVTTDNVGEWVFRFAFVQEIAGRKWDDYRTEVDQLATVLARFSSATLEGRVCDKDLTEFVCDHAKAKVECSLEQAYSAAETYAGQSAA